MRLRSKQFLALSAQTALEVTRQPIALLLVTTCVLFIGLLPLLIMHTMGESARLVRDSALALHLVCGLFLGSFAACSSLTREIEGGTASVVLSKPVSRPVFFLSKFAGVAAVMLVFSLAATLATLLAARAAAEAHRTDWWAAGPLLAAPFVAFTLAGVDNFFTHRPFMSKAFLFLVVALGGAFLVTLLAAPGPLNPGAGHLPWMLVPTGALNTLMILVLSSIALALAARLKPLSVVAVCGVVFLVGLVSDYFFGRHADDQLAAALLYALIPNWQHFWMADALSGDGVPWSYVARAGWYAFLYLAATLCWGIVLFRKRELIS